MIKFASDWQKYPTAIIDLETPNKSFVRLAQMYAHMGIKNHAFPLALIQPELQGVDPHSPDLTQEQKIKIGLECRYNPWYFFREVVRLPPQSGPVPVPFRANRGNIAMFWTFFNNIDSALIQPRQTGKSASTDCLMVDLIYIMAENTKITMITKDDSLRKANVERLKGIRDLLPKYLYTITPRDADNQNELTCRTYNNSYVTGVAQNSESAANNLGRGLTSPILHCDEGPFINFIGVSLPAALAAGTAARDEAKKHGRPYGNIFTTTAGKKDDRDGRFMYDMIHNGAVWTESFFDASNVEELREMVIRNCSGRKALVNITMSHRQLGYTDEWLYNAIAVANATGEAADRDFLNVWTSGTQRSPLSTALLETIRASDMEVLHNEISPDKYILRWYIPEDEIEEYLASGHFVIGLDTSEAVGRDTIAMVIMDVRDLSTVAVGTYNETNLIRFAAFLVHLLVKYTTTTLVIEKKSTAQTIIDYLLLRLPSFGIDPFRRIYNRIVDDYRENEQAYKEVLLRPESRSEIFYDVRKSKFGFNTDAEKRTLLYTTVLQNAAKKAGHLVRDKTLSSEIRSLVEKNGRIDHQASGHDDHVIAWLLCHWFVHHAKNLTHYGIPTTEVMREVTNVGRHLTEKEMHEREMQEKYMQEIETCMDELREATDQMSISQLEHRLRVLTSRITSTDSEDGFSIDALIQKASEERAKRQRINGRQRLSSGHQDSWGSSSNRYGFRVFRS